MPTFESSETKVVKEILAGDSNKYSLLIDKYAPMVFHIVRRFIKDEDEVEELAQQIFVKTYERLDSFDARSKFSSWLYVIGMNHCRDYAKNIRRQNKNFSEMQDYEVENILGHSNSPANDLESKELNIILKEALVSITPDFAEAFLMKYQDGMSYKEMSEQLNVTANALKQRVHRARSELKEYIRTKM